MTTAPHLPTSCRTDDELGAGRHVNAGLQKINYWRTQRANNPGLDNCVEGLRNLCACLLSSSWENIEGSLLVMSPLSLAPDPSADNSVAGMSDMPCSLFELLRSLVQPIFLFELNQLHHPVPLGITFEGTFDSYNKMEYEVLDATRVRPVLRPSLLPAGFWIRYILS